MFNVEFPSEKVLEDYVCHKLAAERLCPVSGSHIDKFTRQYPLSKYGIADVVKIQVSDRSVLITVLELKNEPLKEAHLSQVSKYMTGIQQQAKRHMKIAARYGIDVQVRGEIAGPFDCNRGDFVFLLENIKDINAYSISASLDSGFSSSLINTGWHMNGADFTTCSPIAKEIAALIAEEADAPLNVVPIRAR